MKRIIVALLLLTLALAGSISCGNYSNSSYRGPGNKLSTRVLVSQDVNSSFTFGGLRMVNAKNDTLPFVSEIPAGNTPGLMTLSPTRATLLAFDPTSGSVQIVNTVTQSNTGSITLPGPNAQTPGSTTSMLIPATTGVGYAADPVAVSPLWTSAGAIVVMNLVSNSITTQIGVPGVQTVVSNANGAQLLVFSSDSNSVGVISPLLAVPPVDQGCNTAPNSVCTVVSGFDRPVSGIFNSSTFYVLNCGAECGGTQASVQVLDFSTNPPTPGKSVQVEGATVAFLKGSTVYVAGNSPASSACTGQTTQATTCGHLDIVDLSSMTVTASVVIPDGYHDHMDLSANGQLFVGSHTCTNVNNPGGEVRGCLAIFDTTKAGNTTAVIPPDNGDVTGLQGFTSLNKEYVVEGGNLHIYDTNKNVLQPNQLAIVGQPVDVKAIDFF